MRLDQSCLKICLFMAWKTSKNFKEMFEKKCENLLVNSKIVLNQVLFLDFILKDLNMHCQCRQKKISREYKDKYIF